METNNEINNSCPENLSKLGKLAYKTITKCMKELDLTYTGGCKTFYSPKEWKEKGEEYGINSELIVVYDGGDVSEFFDGAFYDKMVKYLKNVGLYFERCTCWYSAIYKIPQ